MANAELLADLAELKAAARVAKEEARGGGASNSTCYTCYGKVRYFSFPVV